MGVQHRRALRTESRACAARVEVSHGRECLPRSRRWPLRRHLGRLGVSLCLVLGGVRPAASESGELATPRLRTGGWLQTDWVVHHRASGQVETASAAAPSSERFVLRRARVRLDGRYEYAFARLEADLNSVRGVELRPFNVSAGLGWSASGGGARIGAQRADVPPAPADAAPSVLASARPAAAPDAPRAFAVSGTLGLFRIPFGFDAVEGATQRPVLERARVIRALFPGQRDIGVGLDAEYLVFRLSLAVMNGTPVDGTSPLEASSGKDVLGRFGVENQLGPHVRLHVGFSGLHGTGVHPAPADATGPSSPPDGNADGGIDLAPPNASAGTASATARASDALAARGFDRFALGADARLRVALPSLGALTLRAEVVRAQNLDRGAERADPVAAGRDLRELGWIIGASQELTRFALLAVQYDVYDPDTVATEVLMPSRGTRASMLSVAASLRLAPWRCMMQYDHEENAPPQLAPGRIRNDGFTLRGEFVF